MANRAAGYGFSADCDNRNKAKYDPAMERAIRSWLESLTGKSIGPDFQGGLKNGVILCEALNRIQPGTVKKINKQSMPFFCMENLQNFLAGCRVVGVRDSDLFAVPDLYESKNMTLVLQGLNALGAVAGGRGGVRYSAPGPSTAQVDVNEQPAFGSSPNRSGSSSNYSSAPSYSSSPNRSGSSSNYSSQPNYASPSRSAGSSSPNYSSPSRSAGSSSPNYSSQPNYASPSRSGGYSPNRSSPNYTTTSSSKKYGSSTKVNTQTYGGANAQSVPTPKPGQSDVPKYSSGVRTNSSSGSSSGAYGTAYGGGASGFGKYSGNSSGSVSTGTGKKTTGLYGAKY